MLFRSNTTWNGWILREVYFENGEPLGHRERPWQGLTDEEIKDIVGLNGPDGVGQYTRGLFRKIEAKLKEKNG